jgi:formylglycine-generating enzyme required for sulfatase activity
MPRWFLSYHTPDEKLAERIKAAIEYRDSASRVFFAPTNLRAGGAWTDQLAQELAEAEAFILLIGEGGVGKWQVPEYDEALDRWVKSERTFPLIVVLLEGQTAPGLPFLRQIHWIVSPDPASEKEVARIYDAASERGARPPELWRYASPYRGLEAMEEKDSDYFFGRARETVETLNALQAQGRMALLIGNSGVGKSSLAQAGVLAALKRQAWPGDAGASRAWPAVFQNSRRWCFLTLRPGAEPLKALADCFLDVWQFDATDPERTERQLGWMKLLQGEATLAHLIDATDRRREELGQPKPPAFFLYVDQGEELYARAAEPDRLRFSKLIAEALSDARLRVMMSIRSDFYGSLLSDKPLFKARLQIDVPPLSEDELREVVSRPPKLLGAHFDNERLVEIIAQRAAEDSVKDVGALPLLSYTLDDMWGAMLKAGDGVLRLPAQSFELGGVLIQRANRFLAGRPGAEDALRRILTLKVATVREDGEPTRRRAPRAEFSDEEWRLVSELAGYPNRLLVTATTEAGETSAEVAHEAIFRRWDRLREWIAAEREFLTWRSGLEAARRAWEKRPNKDKIDALLMGFALTRAQSWLAKRSGDIPEHDRRFIAQSGRAAQRRKRRVRALAAVLFAAMAAGAVAWLNHDWLKARLKEQVYAFENATPLTAGKEAALEAGAPFKECHDCPEMIVVPAGHFMMGSSAIQDRDERPPHEVTIARPFAVSKFELTFDEWDICADHGDCELRILDSDWGRGRQPAINVSWDDAQTYVKWLSRITRRDYRLLSEAEYEYAARAGTQTEYPWGDFIRQGKPKANCDGCGSQWDNKQTAPVGSFAANRFGLYDMVGNVWEWTEDCRNDSYKGAPADGSAWSSGNCQNRMVRGGSWNEDPESLRSAHRLGVAPGQRLNLLGFRVARTLTARTEAATPTQETR